MEAFFVILGILVYLLMEHPVIFWVGIILFALIFILSVFNGSQHSGGYNNSNTDVSVFDNNDSDKVYKKHRPGQKCDGDCANCPPHYGYRYGRWYYGHDHIEGCERGGNRGGGGIRS